jgi:hypothetical protein
VFFLAYDSERKGYRCWDPIARRIRVSRDVTFDESRPFFTTDLSSSSSSSESVDFLCLVPPLPTTLSLPPSPIPNSSPSPLPPSPPPLSPSPPPPSSPPHPPPPSPPSRPPILFHYTRRPRPPPSPPASSSSSPSVIGVPPLRYNLRDWRTFCRSARLSFVASASILSEPTSCRGVLSHPEWQLAMVEEIAALERTGTWYLVPLSLLLLSRASGSIRLIPALMAPLSATKRDLLPVVFNRSMDVTMRRPYSCCPSNHCSCSCCCCL